MENPSLVGMEKVLLKLEMLKGSARECQEFLDRSAARSLKAREAIINDRYYELYPYITGASIAALMDGLDMPNDSTAKSVLDAAEQNIEREYVNATKPFITQLKRLQDEIAMIERALADKAYWRLYRILSGAEIAALVEENFKSLRILG